MLGGSYYYNADRLKRKEYTDLVKRRKAQEKREKWIGELEARDREDREWREKLGRVRDGKREEAEREAVMEKRRRDKMCDDGKGVIETVKGQLKDAKEVERMRQEAEKGDEGVGAARERRLEMERKQDVQRKMQAEAKDAAGYGDRRTWGVESGGFFGWRHIQNWWNRQGGGER